MREAQVFNPPTQDSSAEPLPAAKPPIQMKRGFCIALLAIAVLIVYGNSLRNDFTMDDRILYIVRNPSVTHPSLHALFTPHPATKVFRPVTFATFALDWKLSAGRPFLFHLVNLLLHLAVTILLFLLLRGLLEWFSHGEALAFAAAVLFAVHPIHTEAVASIVGRAELLAAGFLFAAWIFHRKDREMPTLLCFMLALLSKESAIVFLPLVLFGDGVLGRWKAKPRYLRLAVVTVLYLVVLWKVDGGRFGPADIQMLDNPLAKLAIPWRILNALRIAWKYVTLLFYPATLSCDYSFNQIPVYLDWRLTLPAALASLGALALWVGALWKRQRIAALAGGIYLAGFAVSANVVLPIGTIMAERLAYVPSVGFCLFVAFVWILLYKRQRKLAACLLALVVVALGVRTIIRNRDWKDNLTLWTADARAVPNSARIHIMLGSAYVDTGQFDRALPEMEAALKIDPDFPEAMEAYGLLQSWKGNYQLAGAMLERAFYTVHRGYPNYDGMAVNLAALYIRTDHLEGALQLLNREIAESPGYTRAWATRAIVHYKRGEITAAHEDAEMALRLDPANPDAQKARTLVNSPARPVNEDSLR